MNLSEKIEKVFAAKDAEIERLKALLAESQSQASTMAFRLGMLRGQINQVLPIMYKEWKIELAQDYVRSNYQYVHTEYDGPEDKRIGVADTLDDCRKAIDEYEES